MATVTDPKRAVLVDADEIRAPVIPVLLAAGRAPCDGVGPQESAPMYIGELAKRAGATPKAIRLYEAMGLLGRVVRMGAYRVYKEQHVTQVRLIKQAQAMGFKLADVAPSMRGGRVEPDWATLAEQVERRRAEIAQEIVRLQQLDVQLREINIEIRACAELA